MIGRVISRAELLARIHDEEDVEGEPFQQVIDLSAYADEYGYELADLARRVLRLVRFKHPPLRILEIHPGPVALASGVVGPRVVAIEPQLTSARRLIEDGVEVVHGRWPERRPEGRFDLVIAAGVVSAFSEHELRQQLAGELSHLLAPSGQVLVLEQGTRQGGRAIVELRAGLLGHGVLPVAPCPHQGTCPLSEQRRKGCSVPTGDPSIQLDEPAEQSQDELSFLLAGRAGRTRRDAPLVLRSARRDGDKVNLTVCHAEHSQLIARIEDHTHRGGGLYQQKRGTYVEVPVERLELNGELLPGTALLPGSHVLDDPADQDP